jgi:hypothetical protein
MLNEASIVKYLKRDKPREGLEISTFTYPFEPSAIELWREWVVRDATVLHGMDPDFLLPFLETDENSDKAILVIGTKSGRCTLAVVVVPDTSRLWPAQCWRLFSHDHIDVNGFTTQEAGYTTDDIFTLVVKGLASRNIVMSRLMLSKMQCVHPGKSAALDKAPLFNACFDLSGPNAYRVPGKMRRNNNRSMRNLSESVGEVRLAVAPARLDNTTVFFGVEASGWKDKTKTAINHDKMLRRAYLRATHNKKSLSRAHIFTLYAGSRAVSSCYGLVYPDHVSLLKIGFDEEYSQYSPGSLLISELLDFARRSKKSRIYLCTNPDWACRWKPARIRKETRQIYADSTVGRRLHYIDCTWRSIKRLAHRVASQEPKR